MKRKLYIVGVVFISLLAFSCSNDDFEDSNEGSNVVRTSGKELINELNEKELINELNEKNIDSSTVAKPVDTNADASADSDGEPSNPKPPRK